MFKVQDPTVEFPEMCKSDLSELAQSPTFAMSLGAKELFHTNFLAFLLESTDGAVEVVQQKLKKLLFGHEVGPVLTWREKSDLDLVIVPRSCMEALGCHSQQADSELMCASLKSSPCGCSTVAVVIEAKLKSLPTLQQLEAYDDKLKNGIDLELNEIDCGEHSKFKLILNGNSDTDCATLRLPYKQKAECTGKIRRVLLRPSGGASTGATNWDEIYWEALATEIKPLNGSGSGEGLLSQIVSDYQHSLSHLVSAINKTGTFVRNSLEQQPPMTYGKYYEAITDESFRRQRIHDLVGKYASQVLELHVFENLRKTLPISGAVCNVETNRDASVGAVNSLSFDCSQLKFTLHSATFFTRQQPGIEFEWRASNLDKKKVVRVGVQVQGKKYRHYMCVEGGDNDRRKIILGDVRNLLSDWFVGSVSNGQKLSGLIKKNKESEDTSLYAYGKDQFRYTQTDISGLSLCKLAEEVGNSLCRVSEALQRDPCVTAEKISTFLMADTESTTEKRVTPSDTAVNVLNT